MKKIILLIIIFPFIIISQACCPNNGSSLTTITIENVSCLFYSFNENGIFPELNSYKRNELGILIQPDSISEYTKYAMQWPSLISTAYACQNPHRSEYINYIDSLNFFTKYAFNEKYHAGSNINRLLLSLNINGETNRIEDLNQLSVIKGYFKFSQSPSYDSMQFIIKGRIIDKGDFEVETNLVVLPD